MINITKYNYDMNRQAKLQDLGAKFIRISDVDVKKNMNGVLSALENKIDEGTYPPPWPQTQKPKSKRGGVVLTRVSTQNLSLRSITIL